MRSGVTLDGISGLYNLAKIVWKSVRALKQCLLLRSIDVMTLAKSCVYNMNNMRDYETYNFKRKEKQ